VDDVLLLEKGPDLPERQRDAGEDQLKKKGGVSPPALLQAHPLESGPRPPQTYKSLHILP